MNEPILNTFLFSKSLLDSNVLVFIWCSFTFYKPIQGIKLYLIIIYPEKILYYDFSQIFPCFWWPWIFGWVHLGYSFNQNLFGAFLTLDCVVDLDFWQGEHREKWHSRPIIKDNTINKMITVDVNIDHMGKVMLIKFIHCGVFFFSFLTQCFLWREVTMDEIAIETQGLTSSSLRIYRNCLEFCVGHLSLFSHLFVHWFISITLYIVFCSVLLSIGYFEFFHLVPI
jgi:hypothetical protein